jgi:hypothetical protein
MGVVKTALMAGVGALTALAGFAVAEAQTGAAVYPDLKTVPPSSLRFATVNYQGSTRKVLRFTNTVWNAGEGPLELHGTPGGGSTVSQRIYDGGGGFSDQTVSNDFVFHSGHDHFHFEDFAEYELWTKADYDRWVASGRSVGGAQRVGEKTTFCIMDTTHIESLPGSPSSPGYATCGSEVQGLSVGWGDTYSYNLPEQWIDLGSSYLSDGSYVLRSIADPRNKLYESPSRGDASRESAQANEAVKAFTVRRGRIRNAR